MEIRKVLVCPCDKPLPTEGMVWRWKLEKVNVGMFETEDASRTVYICDACADRMERGE